MRSLKLSSLPAEIWSIQWMGVPCLFNFIMKYMGENFQFRLRAPSFSSYFFPASKSNKNTFNNVFLMFTILQ